MANLTVVHLSDLHIKFAGDETLKLFEHISTAIARKLVKSKLILILVSGDIAFSGKKSEYELIEPEFKKLALQLELLFKAPVKWALVPGNHDGMFNAASKSRALLINGILREGAGAIDESVIETCVQPQEHFFSFEKILCHSDEYTFKDKLLGIKEFKISGKTLQFWELNASWISKIPEQQGNLVFPIERYQQYLQTTADYRFAVLHHPLNWYAQDSYHNLRKALVSNFCGVFSGHEHVSNGHIQKSLGHDNHCVFMEAGALGPHDPREIPTFTVLVLEIDSGAITQTDFKFDTALKAFQELEGPPKSLQIQLSQSRKFQPTEETTASLEELGAPFTHPTRDELKLSDVYVEPEFSTFSVDEKPQMTVKSKQIYDNISSLSYIVVRGDEHHGKTSFLSQIFSRALLANIVPVRMTAKELASGSEDRRDKLIEERVVEHYGHSSLEHYKVLDRNQKMVLLDDLDHLGMNSENYERALGYIKRCI